mmetsp:Transcript_33803/g.44597  ORF Transcript_33803/g.44597 Transcript_33803/m.44597 type:complete len:336 (+) Transcript_33803:49-1056(+)
MHKIKTRTSRKLNLVKAMAHHFISQNSNLLVAWMILMTATVHAALETPETPPQEPTPNTEQSTNPIILSLASKLPYVTFALIFAIFITSIYQLLYHMDEDEERSDEEFFKKVSEETTANKEYIDKILNEKETWENGTSERKLYLQKKLDKKLRQLGEMLKKSDVATTEAAKNLTNLAKQATHAVNLAASAVKQQEALHPSPMQSGETERYLWSQTQDEVEVILPVPQSTQCGDIKHELTPNTISLTVQGQKLIEGNLFATVVPEESTWVLDKDQNNKRIVWSLQKTEPTKNRQWQYIVKGEVKGTLKTTFNDSLMDDLDVDDLESITNAIKALRK